jgi:redox-regulated HSP33 family molecular chaperone
MSSKRYKIETSCPQCGCSAVTHLSAEEIKERYGDVANVEMDCGECMIKYETDMETVCPEWGKDCKIKE